MLWCFDPYILQNDLAVLFYEVTWGVRTITLFRMFFSIFFFSLRQAVSNYRSDPLFFHLLSLGFNEATL